MQQRIVAFLLITKYKLGHSESHIYLPIPYNPVVSIHKHLTSYLVVGWSNILWYRGGVITSDVDAVTFDIVFETDSRN